MTVGGAVADGSSGCEKCPYPECAFSFDPERCTNNNDGNQCNQIFHYLCQTDLEMKVWLKSTHDVDELIAAGMVNPFESVTTKICYHYHEKGTRNKGINTIINSTFTTVAPPAPTASQQGEHAIDLLDSSQVKP